MLPGVMSKKKIPDYVTVIKFLLNLHVRNIWMQGSNKLKTDDTDAFM